MKDSSNPLLYKDTNFVTRGAAIATPPGIERLSWIVNRGDARSITSSRK